LHYRLFHRDSTIASYNENPSLPLILSNCSDERGLRERESSIDLDLDQVTDLDLGKIAGLSPAVYHL
jgi:hypothetical protein